MSSEAITSAVTQFYDAHPINQEVKREEKPGTVPIASSSVCMRPDSSAVSV